MSTKIDGKKLKCPRCGSVRLVRNGRSGKARQFLCRACGCSTVKPKGLVRNK